MKRRPTARLWIAGAAALGCVLAAAPALAASLPNPVYTASSRSAHNAAFYYAGNVNLSQADNPDTPALVKRMGNPSLVVVSPRSTDAGDINTVANLKAAKVLYNEAITVYPDSAVAAEAREKLSVLDAQLGIVTEGAPAAPKAQPKKKKKFWLF